MDMASRSCSSTAQRGLRGKATPAVRILLVDDDLGAIQLMASVLADEGSLIFATNGTDALRLARQTPPDLILLDAEMPGLNGFQLLQTLQRERDLADVPVIFITSHTEVAFEISALEMGAADFIAKPPKPSRVLARVRTQLRIKHLTDELRRAATIDAVTGIANRRCFDELLEREWLRALRTRDPVSLLLIDIDHFKLYNDRYGHPKGDACLRDVAMALAGTCQRPADVVARYGGEEFTVLLPQTALDGAEYVAQKILDAVEALGIAHGNSPTTATVSVSIGITSHDPGPSVVRSEEHGFKDSRSAPCANDLVIAADKALYAAKHAGRARAKTLGLRLPEAEVAPA